MRIKLSNGVILEGTAEQLKEFTAKLELYEGLGTDTMYNSSTHGMIEISKMQTDHIRNAVLKIYKEWLNSLYTIKYAYTLAEKLTTGPDYPTYIGLLKELYKRFNQTFNFPRENEQ